MTPPSNSKDKARFAETEHPPIPGRVWKPTSICTVATASSVFARLRRGRLLHSCDQQFELVGNITYANNMKNSSGGGAGGNESQQGLQPFDSCEGKENGMSGKGYFSSMVQNTTGKQFDMVAVA